MSEPIRIWWLSGMRYGLDDVKSGLAAADDDALESVCRADRAGAELKVARYIEHLAHSTWAIYTWFAWRYERGAIPDLDADAVRGCLASELDNLDRAASLVASDPRPGFYEENATYYATPAKILQKRGPWRCC